MKVFLSHILSPEGDVMPWKEGKGYSYDKSKGVYMAYLCLKSKTAPKGYKKIALGQHKTPEEAEAAVKQAKELVSAGRMADVLPRPRFGMPKKAGRRNTTGQSGVIYNPRIKKFVASIGYRNEYIYLGCFASLDDAVWARRKAEVFALAGVPPEPRVGGTQGAPISKSAKIRKGEL